MSTNFTDEQNIAWAKSLPGKLCSACVIIKSGQKVLMVKANYKNHWTFPGGIVDQHESPKKAALRETLEEVGLKISDAKPFTIVYTSDSNGYPDRLNFSFIAELKSEAAVLNVPNNEIDEAKWVNINEIASIANGRGSYQIFEKYLTNPSLHQPYVETEHIGDSS